MGRITQTGSIYCAAWAVSLLLVILAQSAAGQGSQPSSTTVPHATWQNGPSNDPDFFPLAVWLQDPDNASKFKAMGFNTYVGLWKGPTEDQLAVLGKYGMKVICAQNEVAIKHLGDATIIGWLQDDEPDNAQDISRWKSSQTIKQAWPQAPDRTLEQWGRYGPPVPPKDVVVEYQRMRQNDPTRPVLLNLGQGVAFDNYVGRGYRSGKSEDYPQYLAGCDIVSFDIYPVVHDSRQITGKLEYVPLGVSRLSEWSQGHKIVWDCIECTHIDNPSAIATPEQIRSEVWMSIIHGSRGLIYFVHEFKPKFIEAGLLAHPDQAQAVEQINKQILSLAAVINGPQPAGLAKVKSSEADVPIATMTRKHKGVVYVFAATMRNKPATVNFELPEPANGQMEVLGENRSLPVQAGQFQDTFKPYDVHLYKLVSR